MDEATLLWGFLFGTIGIAMVAYGRKQKKVVPMACGVMLVVFPYVVTGVLPLVGLGTLLIIIPFLIRQ
ncbi:MAG: hypothetical protein HOM44_10185 [Gammaproteobacteria bacterium]|jgi:hypothetical protein|nr:hypothetical protein [Gammaproteobacteria bacterium]MBT5684856.1 hypothetical protein [Gammaproteobacteria bacterium]